MENKEYICKIQGHRIKECMKERNIKGKELAENLNYTPQHISYLMNGKRNLTTDTAIAIANYLNKFSQEKTGYAEVPISQASKDDYLEFVLETGNTAGYYTETIEYKNDIDYRYLLCETDIKYHLEHLLNSPEEQSPSDLFKKAIPALLKSFGYEMQVDWCPDIIRCKNLNHQSALFNILKNNYLNKKYTTQLMRMSDGKTLNLLPCQLFQLFQDYIKTIVSITEREFERSEWYDQLHHIPTPGDAPEDKWTF